MCKVLEDMCEEVAREERENTALRMLADGTLTLEKIAKFAGLPIDEVRKLQRT